MSENEATNAKPGEVRGPAEALSSDEETCLLILAEGGYMAPIGRWTGPLESLTLRGLAKKLDAANYVVTERGKAVATKKDTDFYTDWINASNKAMAKRTIAPLGGDATSATLSADYAHVNAELNSALGVGRSTDEVDDVNEAKAVEATPTLCGLSARQVRALARYYKEHSGCEATDICAP